MSSSSFDTLSVKLLRRGHHSSSVHRISTRTMIVLIFTALVALILCYRYLYLGELGRLTWYDDGVYMGAATQLSHGIMPYRDFVFLHPPGVILLLTPFAFIGRLVGTAVANEAARLFILLVALADVALFARVVRMWPLLPATVGLAFFALHPDVVYADTTIYLEPLLIAACLAGTTLGRCRVRHRFCDQVVGRVPYSRDRRGCGCCHTSSRGSSATSHCRRGRLCRHLCTVPGARASELRALCVHRPSIKKFKC